MTKTEWIILENFRNLKLFQTWEIRWRISCTYVKHYFKLTRTSIIKIKEWQDKTNEHKAATKMKMTSSQKNDTGKVVFYLFDDHREGRETTWLKRVPRACENTLLFRASTVKFGGKSRIRGSGPRVAYKRFELSGNHVRNPLYPRVTTHGRHLHISVWLSRNTPVSGPVYFAPDLSLSFSLVYFYIYSGAGERLYPCYSLSLNVTTPFSTNGKQHTPGCRSFVFQLRTCEFTVDSRILPLRSRTNMRGRGERFVVSTWRMKLEDCEIFCC